jgi:alkylation response protein AidB-like acyl-CoA dehydrogenase
MMDGIEVGRVNVAARGGGVALRAFELAVAYAQARKAFGNFPNGPNGPDHWGFFVDDLRSAFVAAAIGLVLLVLAGTYVIVAAARTHQASSRALLRKARDPLADARPMLVADPQLSRR